MSLAAEVQGLVDALAAELDRPVGLDDHHFRSLAYSAHPDQVDEVRRASILQREAPPEVVAWLESLGIHEIEKFVRVAANEEMSMAARVCLPVRFNSILLGFLWLLDEPEVLSNSQLEEAANYAEEIAVTIYSERVLDQSSRKRERDLLGRALDGDENDGQGIAARLVSGGHLVSAAPYLVLVLRAAHEGGQPMADPIRIRLADSVEQLRRTVAPHHALTLSRGDEVVAVVAPGSEREGERQVETLVATATEATAGLSGWDVRLGVAASAEIEALPSAYRRARLAVRVFEMLGHPRQVARWSELGAYETIAPLVWGGRAVAGDPEPVRRLLASDDAEMLLSTLECYLDLAGDARTAAAALHIHRSSLYGRLRRIEEIGEINLRSGEDRLQMHLCIRVLRLEGRLPDLATIVASPMPSSRRRERPQD